MGGGHSVQAEARRGGEYAPQSGAERESRQVGQVTLCEAAADMRLQTHQGAEGGAGPGLSPYR
jgi:hypothetical protein